MNQAKNSISVVIILGVIHRSYNKASSSTEAEDTLESDDDEEQEIIVGKKLLSQLEDLEKSYPRLTEPNIVKQIKKEAITGSSESSIEIIIKCKVLLRDLFSTNQSITLLKVLSYFVIKSERTGLLKNSKIWLFYKLIHSYSETLDMAMLKNMYHEHLANQPTAEKPLQKAVIAGAGPNGLYSAFQLFLSGMQVTLVNDRTEYIRSHIILLKDNYMFQLNCFLGTKFIKLFYEQNTAGNASNNSISFKYLEAALKDRLKDLEEYANQHKNKEALKLLYGVSVEEIQFPTHTDSKYYAVLKPSNQKIVFDLLVCAGGTKKKDRLRNTYLAIPKEYTVPTNYGVAVLLKGEKYKNKYLLKKIEEKQSLELCKPFQLQPFLRAQNFEATISKSSCLPDKAKAEYYDISFRINQKSISGGIFENDLSICIGAKTDPVLVKFLLEVENEKKKLPQDDKHIKECDDLKFYVTRKWFAALTNHQIDNDVGAFNRVTINLEEKKNILNLNFDPHPVNTSTFDFIQLAIDKSAVEYNVLGHSAVILAVGDSAVNNHFFYANGVITGKIIIDQVVELVKEYNKEKISRSVLTELINEDFKNLKSVLLSDEEKLYKTEPTKQVNEKAVKKMHSIVSAMIGQNETQAKYGFEIRSSGYLKSTAPETSSTASIFGWRKFLLAGWSYFAEKINFNLFYRVLNCFLPTRFGRRKEIFSFEILIENNVYLATITEDGQIQVEINSQVFTFATVVQAAMFLKK